MGYNNGVSKLQKNAKEDLVFPACRLVDCWWQIMTTVTGVNPMTMSACLCLHLDDFINSIMIISSLYLLI